MRPRLASTETVVNMINQGLSMQEVADQLKCSRVTVKNYLVRAGKWEIKKRGGGRNYRKDVDAKKIIKLLKNGYSIDSIACKMQCSCTTVKRRAKTEGFDLKDKTYLSKKKILKKLRMYARRYVKLVEYVQCQKSQSTALLN